MSFFYGDIKSDELKVVGRTGTSGEIELYDNTGSNKITLKAPSSITNYTLTFPTAIGTENQVLSLNGSGALQFSNTSGGITGITYSAPHLFIESASGNVVINAASNLNLGTHTIISNTFSVNQNDGGTVSTGNQSIVLDFNQSSDFHYTLSSGSNLTLNNPSNVNRVGQTGSIILETPSSGTTHQLLWYRGGDSKWYFPAGVAPSISENNSVIDVFSYLVVASDKILINDAVNYQRYTA